VTAQRRDKHSTEFGLWLRAQKEIDSALGFVATNLDFVWCNYDTGEWMLIEEKRFGAAIKSWQREIFKRLHDACKGADGYKGFHLLVFEKTNPEDGKIFLDRKEITKDDLLKFLKFEKLAL
jgi:hypothetical protein